jgi:hypothetical protein
VAVRTERVAVRKSIASQALADDYCNRAVHP